MINCKGFAAAFAAALLLMNSSVSLAEGDVELNEDWENVEEVQLTLETPLQQPSDEVLVSEQETTAHVLQYGDTGGDVREVQQQLKALYYYSGNISGRYREGTRAAVKAFQKDFGLEATGIADTHTQAILFATTYRPRQYGSSGEDVRRMQTRLAELGYYKGKISGNYLEGTRAAIRVFQRKMGMEATGIATSETQQLLYSSNALAADANENLGKYATATPAPATTPEP